MGPGALRKTWPSRFPWPPAALSHWQGLGLQTVPAHNSRAPCTPSQVQEQICCAPVLLLCQCLSSLPRDQIQSSANYSNSVNCASAPTPVTTAADERNDACFWEPFDLHQSREQLLISDKEFDNFSSRSREILVTKSWFNHAAHHTDTALDVASKLCATNNQEIILQALKSVLTGVLYLKQH